LDLKSAAGSKIVILGAGGFLGLALARHASTIGHEVVCVSRSYQWQTNLLKSGVKCIEAQICDVHQYLSAITCGSSIVYMAGTTDLAKAEQDGIQSIAAHLQDLAVLLQDLADAKIHIHRFVLISSGGTVYGECSEEGANELTTPLKPKSFYGLRNVFIEQTAKMLCARAKYPLCILRLANPYGIEQLEVRRKGLILSLFSSALTGTPAVLRGEGLQKRDYIYIEDVIKYILSTIAEPFPVEYDVVNVCTGVSTSALELVRAIEFIAAKKVNVSCAVGQPAYEVASSVLERGKMSHAFDPSPLDACLGLLWKLLDSI
jgi:UDP-glucose 4-epimerase